MKDETKELFLQSYNVILSRRINYYHEQYKDCDPQKTIEVKRRIKMEMYSIFYECTNDEHICIISKFLQYFTEQVDQFQSRSYDEHIDNAKKAFEIYYSCRERDFKDGSGKILEWSNKRIACELGKYKAELDFYEMQIEPPSLNYDDEGEVLNDKYTLVPSTTPIVNDTSLFDEMEQEIAEEISKAREYKVLIETDTSCNEIKSNDYSDYKLLETFYGHLILANTKHLEIDFIDLMSLILDLPTSSKINWCSHIEHLASFVAYIHLNQELPAQFYGKRKKSINYEKWASLVRINNKPIKSSYLEDAICNIRTKNNSKENTQSTQYEYSKKIGGIISKTEAKLKVFSKK